MLVNTVVLRILINDLKREMRIFVLNGLKPFGVFVLNCDDDDARLRFSLSLDTLSMRVHPFFSVPTTIRTTLLILCKEKEEQHLDIAIIYF